jgi:hypothetical protein
VGAGVGLVVARTSNSAVARVEPEAVPITCLAPGVALSTVSAPEVWGPTVVFGTLKEARKPPRPLVDAIGMPALAPSQVNCSPTFGEKFCPVTVTFVPGTPLPGESVSVGPEARVLAKGTTYSPTDATITSVANHATARFVRPRGGVGGASGTHSVPFQNVMRQRLHSATRLTQGVPWLCGPASRRVCYFVEASRRNAVSPRVKDARGGYGFAILLGYGQCVTGFPGQGTTSNPSPPPCTAAVGPVGQGSREIANSGAGRVRVALVP